MSEIILVGTVHTDLYGPRRLEKILREEKPGVIAIEGTPKGATKAWNDYQKNIGRLNDPRLNLLYTPEEIERLKLGLVQRDYGKP